jgi:hypothetical protein
MKYGPPGMDRERWMLHLKEQAAARGEAVTFTPDEIVVLQAEAEWTNATCTPEEIKGLAGH